VRSVTFGALYGGHAAFPITEAANGEGLYDQKTSAQTLVGIVTATGLYQDMANECATHQRHS
jgi:hypothetical protein